MLHDLVLVPLSSLLDRAAQAGWSRSSSVPWINHVRVPAFLSGLLFLVWFPLILGIPPSFEDITATSIDRYLARWLAVTDAFLGLSALVYSARRVRASWRAARSPGGAFAG